MYCNQHKIESSFWLFLDWNTSHWKGRWTVILPLKWLLLLREKWRPDSESSRNPDFPMTTYLYFFFISMRCPGLESNFTLQNSLSIYVRIMETGYIVWEVVTSKKTCADQFHVWLIGWDVWKTNIKVLNDSMQHYSVCHIQYFVLTADSKRKEFLPTASYAIIMLTSEEIWLFHWHHCR